MDEVGFWFLADELRDELALGLDFPDCQPLRQTRNSSFFIHKSSISFSLCWFFSLEARHHALITSKIKTQETVDTDRGISKEDYYPVLI